MNKARLESFSDGVIAVAITLLVLNLKVPSSGTHNTLAHQLLHQWPSYAAYVVSFATVGIIWVNHHVVIGRLARVDHVIILLNLLLLLCIVVVPFATSLVASYLNRSRGANLAAGVYAGTFLVLTVVFVILNWHILFPKAHLLHTQIAHVERRTIIARGFTGVVPYAVATVVAPFSPYATLSICAAIAVFYASPLATGASWRRDRSRH